MTAPGAGLGDGHGTIDRKKAAGTIDRKVAKQDAAKRAQVISLNVSFKQFIHIKPRIIPSSCICRHHPALKRTAASVSRSSTRMRLGRLRRMEKPGSQKELLP